MSQLEVKKGSEVELTIDSLAYGGRGVARVGDFVVFVSRALPGQTVQALVYRKKRRYAEARTLEVIKESPHAVAPRCEHFAFCGGCQWQHLSYAEQVEQKRCQVEAIYQHQTTLTDFAIDQVIPAEQTYHYRNKMEFTFSNRRWVLPDEPQQAQKDFALGLHLPGRFDKILDINECLLHPPEGNAILNLIREMARGNGLKPYNARTHEGFLRHLVLRFGFQTGQTMVNIVTAYENREALEPLVKALLERFPDLTAIVNNINTRKADIAFGEYELLLHGKPTIEEKLGNLTLEISANSFFQTNTAQAERLYGAVLEGADLTGKEVVYDLYCGAGSISLFLAPQAKEVHGFEMISTAVEDATRNAVANGIGNTHFYKVNLEQTSRLKKLWETLTKPEIVILDPPRAGLHKNLILTIQELKPKRIVYVACNPTTQARDIASIVESSYTLQHMTMVDMFPHTPHIETVAVLEKAG